KPASTAPGAAAAAAASGAAAGAAAPTSATAPGQTPEWGVPSGSGSTAHRAPEAPAAQTEDSAPADSDKREGVLGAATAAAAGGAGVAGMTAAAVGAGTAGAQPGTGEQPGAPSTAGAATPAGADERATDHPDGRRDGEHAPGGADVERSSASQWLILVAQVLASAVAGAALFIGFQLLWNNLTWVAFALAIVVIVGLVAMVRVLRRSNDTVSIALAVIVGLGVTCGPLLLRLVT
ncbi:MAG: hypothetical protein ACI39C_08145, partial [Dietzia sp.]